MKTEVRTSVLRRDALPRICRLEKNDSEAGFGFSIRTLRDDIRNVALVLPDSLAEKNGFSSGDHVLEVNGQKIEAQEDFLNMVYSRQEGVDISVVSFKQFPHNEISISI